MMALLIGLITLNIYAAPVHWSGAQEVRERHEFYRENEVITKPKGTWQTLFAVVFVDRTLKLQKDCVYYRVPGETDGALKLRALGLDESCETHIDEPGDTELQHLKSLQFSLGTELVLHFTGDRFRSTRWVVPMLNRGAKKEPELFMSSAEYRSPKLIFLAPVRKGPASTAKVAKSGELCHAVSDDCKEVSPSTCEQCAEGWYEVPNGCAQGPKYCGVASCGQKNRPACRRGMRWQRLRKRFECTTDQSFVFCAPGLTVQCEGARAYCR